MSATPILLAAWLMAASGIERVVSVPAGHTVRQLTLGEDGTVAYLREVPAAAANAHLAKGTSSTEAWFDEIVIAREGDTWLDPGGNPFVIENLVHAHVIRPHVLLAYESGGNYELVNLEQLAIAEREAGSRLQLGTPDLQIWAGSRFYRGSDVGTNDYLYFSDLTQGFPSSLNLTDFLPPDADRTNADRMPEQFYKWLGGGPGGTGKLVISAPELTAQVDSTSTVIAAFHSDVDPGAGTVTLTSVRETARNDMLLLNNFDTGGGSATVQPTAVSAINDYVYVGENWHAAISEDRGDLVAWQTLVRFSGPQDLSAQAAELPRGDVDGDGDRDRDDAAPFHIVLNQLDAQLQKGWVPANADMDADGDVDFADRELFMRAVAQDAPAGKGSAVLDPGYRNPALGFGDINQGDPVPGHPDHQAFATDQLRSDGVQLVFLQTATGPGGLGDQISLLRYWSVEHGYRTLVDSTEDLGDGAFVPGGFIELSDLEGGRVALSAQLQGGGQAIYRIDVQATLAHVFDDGFE